MTLAIFNGSHTIQNKTTGARRTFRIRTVLKGNLKGKRIVALLTGPDNTSDYRGFAFVTDSGRILVWQKYRGQGDWDAYARMIEKIVVERDPAWTSRYDHLLEGTCRICNRKLTHPASIVAGIGPECASRNV